MTHEALISKDVFWRVQKAGDKERAAAMKKHAAELAKAEKRKAEVKNYFGPTKERTTLHQCKRWSGVSMNIDLTEHIDKCQCVCYSVIHR